MKTSKFLPLLLLLVVLACSCGGQKYTGSPNDPNEQQGNSQAKPANSDTNKTNRQPSDNEAGRNAHSGSANAGDNK